MNRKRRYDVCVPIPKRRVRTLERSEKRTRRFIFKLQSKHVFSCTAWFIPALRGDSRPRLNDRVFSTDGKVKIGYLDTHKISNRMGFSWEIIHVILFRKKHHYEMLSLRRVFAKHVTYRDFTIHFVQSTSPPDDAPVLGRNIRAFLCYTKRIQLRD